MGILDFITGQNPNQGAINQAQSSANQATDAENQLIQQGLMPIINDRLAAWNQYYSPLQGGIGSEVSSLLKDNGLPGLSQADLLASINPAMRDSLTGVPLSGISNEAMSYYMNPGGTLSGLSGVGGDALSQYLNPNTNLAGVSPLAEGMYANEAINGLSPQTIGAAVNPLNAQVQQNINSFRNSLGAGVPNVAGMAEDMNLQGLQSEVGLLGNLAGQNQQFQNQGLQGLLGTASGLDQQTMARIAAALQTAGGIDQQTQSMINQGYNIANQQSGQGMNYLGTGLNTQQGLFGDIMSYLGQGNDILSGAQSSLGNLANLYGQSAGNAANQAYNLASAGNQMNSATFSGLAGLAGSLAGAGLL